MGTSCRFLARFQQFGPEEMLLGIPANAEELWMHVARVSTESQNVNVCAHIKRGEVSVAMQCTLSC